MIWLSLRRSRINPTPGPLGLWMFLYLIVAALSWTHLNFEATHGGNPCG